MFTDISKLLMTVISQAGNIEEKILKIHKIKYQNAKPLNQRSKLCNFSHGSNWFLMNSLKYAKFSCIFCLHNTTEITELSAS